MRWRSGDCRLNRALGRWGTAGAGGTGWGPQLAAAVCIRHACGAVAGAATGTPTPRHTREHCSAFAPVVERVLECFLQQPAHGLHPRNVARLQQEADGCRERWG